MGRPWAVLVAAVAGLAVLAGVIAFGKLTRDDLDRRGYYTLTLADLAVPAPPGLSRQQFLDEVCYESRLPAKLDRTDATAGRRLQAAFAAHPWVESASVGDLAGPQPVRLVFRRPTLVVGDRVVDRLGVTLPLGAPTDGLPAFTGAPDQLAAVAKTVARIREQAPELSWRSAVITSDGLVLERVDGAKAAWGFSRPNEPTPEAKLARLKAWKGGTLDLRTTED
jgi:hypothetical protein